MSYQLYICLIKHITGHILLWSVVLTYDHTYVLSAKLKGDFVKCSSLIKAFSVNPSLTDSCVHLNTARYVLSCSKYFEQLKTPCPCRKLDFLRSRKSFQIYDAIFTLLNGLNYSLPTLLLIL